MSAPQSPRQPDDTAPYGPPAPSRYRTVHLQRAKDEGASAPYEVLYEKFGLTVDRVVAAARTSLARAEAHTGP